MVFKFAYVGWFVPDMLPKYKGLRDQKLRHCQFPTCTMCMIQRFLFNSYETSTILILTLVTERRNGLDKLSSNFTFQFFSEVLKTLQEKTPNSSNGIPKSLKLLFLTTVLKHIIGMSSKIWEHYDMDYKLIFFVTMVFKHIPTDVKQN